MLDSTLARIMAAPLNIDQRGNSMRVVIAADNYTVARINEGMNDQAEYAKIFAAAPVMLRTLRTIAGMAPYSIDASDDALEDAVATLNRLIEDARALTDLI